MSHRPRKRFGQNFLHDPVVIGKIVSAVNPASEDRLFEIGPGQGAITVPLLAAAGELSVVELDRDLIGPLQRQCAGIGKLVIHSADALTFDFCQLAQDAPLRVVGNLPYNISTPLLFHLLQQHHCISANTDFPDKTTAQAGAVILIPCFVGLKPRPNAAQQ